MPWLFAGTTLTPNWENPEKGSTLHMWKLSTRCQRHQNERRSSTPTLRGETQASPINHALQSHQPPSRSTNSRLHPTKTPFNTSATPTQIYETQLQLWQLQAKFLPKNTPGLGWAPYQLHWTALCGEVQGSHQCLNHRRNCFLLAQLVYTHYALINHDHYERHHTTVSSFSCWKGFWRVPA